MFRSIALATLAVAAILSSTPSFANCYLVRTWHGPREVCIVQPRPQVFYAPAPQQLYRPQRTINSLGCVHGGFVDYVNGDRKYCW